MIYYDIKKEGQGEFEGTIIIGNDQEKCWKVFLEVKKVPKEDEHLYSITKHEVSEELPSEREG